jgi:hypothetical protein
MAETSLPAVAIDREASLTFDWKGFASGLVETIGNFVLKGWADGGVSGIASLSKLFMTASLEEPPQARAWRLVALCFAWALDDLKGKEALDPDRLRTVLRDALSQAKVEVDGGGHGLTAEFLSNPPDLEIYKIMREAVVDRRVELGIREHYTNDDLRAKLDDTFTLGVLDVWSTDPAYYNAISEHLDTPVNAAAERVLNWQHYRRQLMHDFRVSPTFGQETTGVSLSQVYVPLRAYWEEDVADGRRERNEDGRLPKGARGVWLDEAIESWLQEHTATDWLRLVGGGPGSGKSTTLRALAA